MKDLLEILLAGIIAACIIIPSAVILRKGREEMEESEEDNELDR